MNRFMVVARPVAARALVALIVTGIVAACAGAGGTVPSASVEPSAASVASASPSERATPVPSPAAVFPTAAFADISSDPVSEDGGEVHVAEGYAQVVGHAGEHVGYVAWAGCLPEDGSVVVVLSNRVVEDIGAMARPW